MKWNNTNTKHKGDYTENLAKNFLIENKLKIIAQNFNCRYGEIDIIAKNADAFIFIEVKYRKQNQFGGAISAVAISKQEKIRSTAQFFLQQHQLNEYNTPCRFDIVAIDGNISKPQITWLPNAF
ncbi:MAG: YraN family protein [Thalassotalea sp.]